MAITIVMVITGWRHVQLFLKLFFRSEVISPAYLECTKTLRTVKLTMN
jgi:hypothetical protein